MLNYGWAFIDKPFVPKKLVVDMVNVVFTRQTGRRAVMRLIRAETGKAE